MLQVVSMLPQEKRDPFENKKNENKEGKKIETSDGKENLRDLASSF